MKNFYPFKLWKPILLLVIAVVTFNSTKAQPTVITADPSLISFDITNASNTSVDANLLTQNSVYNLKLAIVNLGPGYIPVTTTRLVIGLGTNLILDPAFNLATAPYNNYFTWSSAINAGQVEIIGILHTSLPAYFAGQLSFGIKANIQGSSTVTGNWLVINSNPGVIRLTDPNSGNNTADIAYTIGAAGPLPVTITRFGAHNKDCRIDVNWSVAQEINVAKYEVEVSKDGTNFVKAAELPAISSSDYSTSFALTDQLKAATLLVRLKSIDKDGSFKYTQIVPVSGICAGKSQQDIYCYPNPVISEDYITIASKGELFNATYQLSLIDVSGRNYLNKQVIVNNASSFRFEFGKKLVAGKYFIILRRADGTTNAVLQFERL